MNVTELHGICQKLIEKGHGDIDVYIDYFEYDVETRSYDIMGTAEWESSDREINHLHIIMGEMVSG